MKNKPWTKQELNTLRHLRQDGKSNPEIAKAISRTVQSVENQIHAQRLPAPVRPLPSELPAAEQDEKARVAYWKVRAKDLEKALSEAAQSKIAEDILAERVLELAPTSYKPAAFDSTKLFRPNAGREAATSQSAVALFSDTHIGSVVHPAQTLGMGNYNFEIFLRRLKRFERSIFSILSDHTTTPITEIVVPMLGDLLDGALGHGAESGQPNTILSQFYAGGHAIAQFIRNLSTLAPLRIYGVVGNHTRWQNQHKMPSKNRNSNFDMLLYLYVQALTRELPTVKWELNWQPFATFEVQGFPFYCGHGDNLRGGDKALGLPAHAMGRMVGTTTQLFTRAGRETPAYYCVGHLHRPISIPHAKGEIIVNGAFPGIDGYALGEYFNSSHPSQKFWLMHPKFGRAATYDLRLDLGDNDSHGYELPDVFPCK